MIANTELENFRATLADLSFDKDGDDIVITAKMAEALQIREGDTIRIATV